MNIVGVTSCIAGLAHTPMAARSLTKAGNKLGHSVRIEQQGAMGQVDTLTASEITSAQVVIIAADRAIEGEDRFKGIPIVRVKIGSCISKAEAIIKQIVAKIEGKG